MRTMITSVFVSVLLVGFTGTVVGWGSPAPFSAEPKCAGQLEGTECWMALANHPECCVWNPNLQPDETVTWTAECSGGLAQGTGTLTWVLGSGKRVDKGLLQDGKRHDRWVESSANGTVREGSYVDGKRHGRWVWRYANGTVRNEGSYVDGKEHGHWVESDPYGGVWEGTYVDGKQHGHWVERNASGTVREGSYVDGKEHGHWVFRDAWGERVVEGPFVDGEQHGRWVFRWADGTVWNEEIYVNGELQ